MRIANRRSGASLCAVLLAASGFALATMACTDHVDTEPPQPELIELYDATIVNSCAVRGREVVCEKIGRGGVAVATSPTPIVAVEVEGHTVCWLDESSRLWCQEIELDEPGTGTMWVSGLDARGADSVHITTQNCVYAGQDSERVARCAGQGTRTVVCVGPYGAAGDVACVDIGGVLEPTVAQSELHPLGFRMPGLVGLSGTLEDLCVWNQDGMIQCLGHPAGGFQRWATRLPEFRLDGESLCIIETNHQQVCRELTLEADQPFVERSAEDFPPQDRRLAARWGRAYKIREGQLWCRNHRIEAGEEVTPCLGPGARLSKDWTAMELPSELAGSALTSVAVAPWRPTVCVSTAARRHACLGDLAGLAERVRETTAEGAFEYLAGMDGYDAIRLDVGLWTWCGERGDGTLDCRSDKRTATCRVSGDDDAVYTCFDNAAGAALDCEPVESIEWDCDSEFARECLGAPLPESVPWACDLWATSERDGESQTVKGVVVMPDGACRLAGSRVECQWWGDAQSPACSPGGIAPCRSGAEEVAVDDVLTGTELISLTGDGRREVCVGTYDGRHACLERGASVPDESGHAHRSAYFRHKPEYDGLRELRLSPDVWCGRNEDDALHCQMQSLHINPMFQRQNWWASSWGER